MYEKFTDRARRVIVLAQDEARRLEHGYIGPEHILLGLVSEGGAGVVVLEALGITPDAVREKVEQAAADLGHAQAAVHIPFTAQAKSVLQQSLAAALDLGNTHIGTEHLLLGLIREVESLAARVLTSMGADLELVREKTVTIFAVHRQGTDDRLI